MHQKMQNISLVFHKIVLRTNVGNTDLFRPGYSHLLCFSKNGKIGKPLPDVIDKSKQYYNNSIGLKTLNLIFTFLKDKKNIHTIFDPFAGKGSILFHAKLFNYNFVGVELLEEYCDIINKRLKQQNIFDY